MSEALKKEAGLAALDFVKPGIRLGIGTGSTAEAFIRVLAPKVLDGLNIIGVPTSERTATLCNELGVPLTTLEETPELDLTIDGADEIDPALNLIKGAGGALLREKIVAMASADMIVIADESKLVSMLGGLFPLPVEVNKFGLAATKTMVERCGKAHGMQGGVTLREVAHGKPFVTDGGHLILDASFGRIADPVSLAADLNAVPGVVEHGLFTGLASRAIVAGKDGVRIVEPVS